MDDKNKRYARGIRHTAKKQRNVYHEQVDKFFKQQMIYLTGEKKLHDDSDQEDPCKDFIIPMAGEDKEGKREMVDSEDDGGDIEMRKFVIEINDKDKIEDIIKESREINLEDIFNGHEDEL